MYDGYLIYHSYQRQSKFVELNQPAKAIAFEANVIVPVAGVYEPLQRLQLSQKIDRVTPLVRSLMPPCDVKALAVAGPQAQVHETDHELTLSRLYSQVTRWFREL
jgi:hypothetical protein